jgi:serine/threonine-protein kinase
MADEALDARLRRLLDAQYQLHRELGGGGMARVFVATDRALGREIVIKTLPSELFGVDAIERFKREMRLAARLQHPNIVPLLTAGEVETIPYYTMPLVDGASLRERFQRGPLAVAEAIAVLRDMARALSAAHAQGIVHRDIKPENVLLTRGAALITDFGVARALSEATHGGNGFQTGTGIAVGTPAYMAPEQFAADPTVDQRADLYAWGIVAYEALTGAHPFAGTTGRSLLQAHLTQVPARVDTVNSSVPRSIADIVAQCLAKDPADRPRSADAVSAVLDAVPTLDATPTPSVAARSRRREVGIVIGAALLVVAATGAWWFTRQDSATGNEQRIAIAPFRVGGAAPSVHYLREGLADLMAPQLASIPGVETPSVRVMFAKWREIGGSAEADLEVDQARKAAQRAGAGQLVLGEVVGTDAHVIITARLVRVADGRELQPARVEGRADSAGVLATQLVASLLSLRDGGTLDRVRAVITANPAALVPYLKGEQLYRRGAYAEAVRSYAEAYAQDTTFALAALRTAMANGWSTGAPAPGDWTGRAWAMRDRLHGLDSLSLQVWAGYGWPVAAYPRRETMARRFRDAERSNSAEIWYQAGDNLVHAGPSLGDSTFATKALDAFRRAEALDSTFAPALEHQADLYIVTRRDTAAARAALARQARLDSLGDFFMVTRMRLALQLDPAHLVDGMRTIVRAGNAGAVQTFVAITSAFDQPKLDYPAQMRTVHAALETLRREGLDPAAQPMSRDQAPSFAVQLGFVAHRLNTGEGRTMKFVVRSPDEQLQAHAVNLLSALLWDGDSLVAQRSADSLTAWWRSYTPQGNVSAAASAMFALGMRALDRGDTASAERARTQLATMRSANGQLSPTAVADAAILGSYLAVARKQPAARAELERLDSLLIDGSSISGPLSRLPGNLIAAKLWQVLGDDRRAAAAASRQDWTTYSPVFASAFMRESARIAERLGDREKAIRLWRSYLALREHAVPALQQELPDIRARLAKLEQESRGR